MNTDLPAAPLAADTLRSWAMDEELKETVLANPFLAHAASKIARRYAAGESAAPPFR